MANYFPLIVNSGNATIYELPAGDNLDLASSNIVNAVSVTATSNINGGNIVSVAAISGASLSVSGGITAGNIVPLANSTYDLGSNTLAWNSLYVAGNTIYLGTLQLKDIGSNTFAIYTSDGTTQANIDVGAIDVSSITQGNSAIGIAAPNGNAYITVGGNANVLLVTSTGISTPGTFTSTGNATVGNLSTSGIIDTGNLAATGTIFASGNVTGDNFFINGNASAAGNITSVGNVSSGNISTGGLITATGNITAGNLITSGLLSVTGTINTLGNINTNDSIFANGVISAAGTVTAGNLVTGGTLSASGNANVGNLGVTGVFATTLSATGTATLGNVSTGGTISASGNANVGNLGTTGLFSTTISASGNANVGNLDTTGVFATTLSASGNANVGNLEATGNITGSYIFGNGSQLTGIDATSIQNGTSNVRVLSSGGDVAIGIGGTSNVVVVATTGMTVTGIISATGNITGGNVISSTTLSTTGTATAGNIVTGGTITATGNIQSNGTVNSNTISSVSGALTVSTGSGDLILNPSGNIDASNNYINNLLVPVQAQDAATKQYVDNAVSSGITIHDPVQLLACTFCVGNNYAQGGTVATVTDTVANNTVVFSSAIDPQVNDQLWFANSFEGIAANTAYFVVSAPNTSAAVLSLSYSGSPVTTITSNTGLSQSVRINSGQGATISNDGANVRLIVDSTPVTTGDRIILTAQTNPEYNGVYDVTEQGAPDSPGPGAVWVLTRSSDMNTYVPDDINGLDVGDYFYVQNGVLNKGEAWVLTAPTGPVIIGYNNLTFTQFSASQVYSANTAAGLDLTGTIFSAKVDNDTTAFSGGNIVVKASANLTTPNIGAATGTSLSLTGTIAAGNVSTGGTLSVGGNAAISGNISSTTAAQNTNTTQLATTAFVLGQASSTTPTSIGTNTVGTGTTFARDDHTHTGVASLANGGGITASVSTGAVTLGSTATNNNTANAIVARDANGDFSTGGITTSRGVNEFAGGALRIENPGGASYYTAGSVTGTIAIRLPLGMTNVRFRMRVAVYDATGNNSFDLLVGAYIYGPPVFGGDGVSTSSYMISAARAPIGVSWNWDGTYWTCCIGSTSQTWSSPTISVTDVQIGLGASASFVSGWVVSIAGSFGTGSTYGPFNSALLATSATTAGTVTTAAQGNITSVGTLTSLSVSGNVTGGNILTGGLVSATGAITGAALTGTSLSVSTGNITGGNLLISGAILDSAQLDIQTTASNANIVLAPNGTGNVNIGRMSASGNITAAAFYGPLIGAATTAGTVTTAAQGNITSVGTLTSLSLSGLLTGASSASTDVNTANDTGSFSARGNASTVASMTFHRTGAYAINMGLGTDNVFRIGGWSASANALQLTGAGALTLLSSLTASSVTTSGSGGNITGANVVSATTILTSQIQNSGSNGVGNIGNSSVFFNTVFAKATSAQYADLAEAYAADAEYPPGTVLVFGGNAEVTVATQANDAAVAGVVSTNPAHVMNSGLNVPNTVVLALTGRVPTRVVGPVRKGQMMVSAGNGHAQACTAPAMGTVIGKALENFDGETGIIEVVVGRL
jgi:hypothetical protein